MLVHEFIVCVVNVFIIACVYYLQVWDTEKDTFYDCITLTFVYLDGVRCISATCAFMLVHEFIVCVVNVFIIACVYYLQVWDTEKDTFYDCITLTFVYLDGVRCISATCAFMLVHEFIVCVVNVFIIACVYYLQVWDTEKDTFYDCITLTFVYLCIHNL